MSKREWFTWLGTLAACIVAGLVLVSLQGCATPLADETLHVTQQFTVRVVSAEKIAEETYALGLIGSPAYSQVVDGWQVITVPSTGLRDLTGLPLPNMALLGHEVWHLRELGGMGWHE